MLKIEFWLYVFSDYILFDITHKVHKNFKKHKSPFQVILRKIPLSIWWGPFPLCFFFVSYTHGHTHTQFCINEMINADLVISIWKYYEPIYSVHLLNFLWHKSWFVGSESVICATVEFHSLVLFFNPLPSVYSRSFVFPGVSYSGLSLKESDTCPFVFLSSAVKACILPAAQV